jgi:hypothetical protein
MTQLACGHFERKPLCAGEGTNIRPLSQHRELEPFRRAPHQAFVGIAAPAPKPMIEMRRHELPVMLSRQLMKHMQQHDRIHPTGNCHQDWLARAKEATGADALLNVV